MFIPRYLINQRQNNKTIIATRILLVFVKKQMHKFLFQRQMPCVVFDLLKEKTSYSIAERQCCSLFECINLE